MLPVNHLHELERIPENKEFERMTLLEKVMFLYRKLTRKQSTLISGKNIMTINGTDILQSGNLEIGGSSGSVDYINTTGESGTLTEEDVEKLLKENSNVIIVNDNEYYHKMYENSVYYAFVNVDTITTTHISYKAIYINKERHTFTKEESIEVIDYNDLINLPSLNGVTLSGNVYSSELGIEWDDIHGKPTIPTKTSDLTNDSEFVDKDFVNSSIATATANFRGTFQSVAELQAYSGPKTINDYAFVIIYDPVITTQVKQYDRYKYNGSNWVFEYTLNNSSFTSAQWSAINSGITDNKVTKYDGYESSINGKQDTLVSGTNIKTINNNSLLGSGNIEIQGSGTSDYEELENIPQINGTDLIGNMLLGVIQETGSNSNGYYIKFTNGLMICYYGYGIGRKSTVSQNSYTDFTFNYPISFISNPLVIPIPFSDSSSYADIQNFFVCLSGIYANSCRIRIFRGSGSSRDPYLNYLALGYWK